MRQKAEQLFVRSLTATLIFKLATFLGLHGLVGDFSPLLGTVVSLLPFAALAVAAFAIYQIARTGNAPVTLKNNRRRPYIIGWAVVAVIFAVIWAYYAGLLPSLPRSMKAYRAMLNSLGSIADVATILAFLFAAIMMVVGSIDDAHSTPGKSERLLAHNLMAKIAAIPMVLTALGVFVGATLWTVYHSFTNSKLLPKSNWVGMDQYERLWSANNNRWWVSIENLAIYGLCSMTFSLVIGFLLAAMLDQKIRFENTFRTIFLYPFALSFIVTGLVWQWILTPEFGVQKIVQNLGFENFTFDPLYNPEIVIYGILIAGLWQGTGLIMCLMLAGLRGIDEDIWKAARVDGIPMWKTYIFIVIPMMRPVFITTLVLIASGIVRVYDLVVAQTSGGPGIASEVPAKYVYEYMFTAQNLAQGFAASSMMLLAVLVIVVPWAILEFREQRENG